MKWFLLSSIGLILIGCSSPNVERLTQQLGSNNAAFFLEVPTHRGTIRVSRAVPNIGFGSIITDKGAVSVAVPTNVHQTVTYLLPQPGTQVSTNVVKGKP